MLSNNDSLSTMPTATDQKQQNHKKVILPTIISPKCHDPPASQTDRRTEGQTTCGHKTALCTIVHRAIKLHIFLLHLSSSIEFEITGYYNPSRFWHAVVGSQYTDLSCHMPNSTFRCTMSVYVITIHQRYRRIDGCHATCFIS